MKQILILTAIILAESCAKNVEPVQVVDSSSEETGLPYELTQDKYNELLDAYKLPAQPVYSNGKKVDPENIIDANSNDIEDGWEREIVFKYHEDITNLNTYMSRANVETKLTKAYLNVDTSEYVILSEERKLSFSCGKYFADLSGKDNRDSELRRYFEVDSDSYKFILKRDSAITKVVGGGMDFGIDPEDCDKYKDENLWKQ